MESWQKRYVLISLVDTYSRVVSFHISDTENSLGVARAVAKYILKYGKPKVIKGDNGKAFLSKYTKAVMENLDIELKSVRAYSGWLKPYVENTFRALQDRIISWGKGYIGHNVAQRQAIEFFFSKKERRLKKGALTNLKELDSFESMLYAIDTYTDTLLNNRYLDSLGMTPTEAYNQKANEAVAMN
ncbi:transposase family protein, partial [Helicobacter bilis]|uniref:integrase catalytic domain-containing protein n=1 Tax=Helicobacter bilis TaxID=37372 RepID=UPI002941D693